MNYEDLNVLVVDDHMIIRKLVSTQLQGIGIKNIDSAEDGEQAMDAIETRKYDLVFLDWAMPQKTGLTVLQECREKPEFDNLAIIMLTAASEQKSVRSALEAGATSYIIKPMSINTLQDKLDHALEWINEKKNDSENNVNSEEAAS
jgi:two-component system chemotaxis response regulator CheY